MCFSRWGPRIEFESGKCGAIPILARIVDHPAFHGISMNVISVMREIHLVADSMIGESSLPYLSFATNNASEFMRVRSFDQLNGPLDCHVRRGSQQEMNVLGHQHKRMQLISTVAAMPIERFQKHPDVRFDNEQSTTIPRREGYE